jgi:hypothetical protein
MSAPRSPRLQAGEVHYEPGRDCWPGCKACKLISRVPPDVLAESRRLWLEHES